MHPLTANERDHQDAWYARAISSQFFDREGFRRLVAANLAALERQVPINPDMRLVSIGAGLGDYELALAPRVRSIVAVELSDTAVTHARARAARAGVSNVEFRCGAAANLEVADGSADLVYALGVFHHLPGRESRAHLLAHARRWLRPGGWLYLRDPSSRGLARRLAYRFFQRRIGCDSPHEQHLDPRAMAAEVEAAGFSDVRLDYTDVIMGPLPWVIATGCRPFWGAAQGFDRAWLAVRWLRPFASQFSVTAHRQGRTPGPRAASQ